MNNIIFESYRRFGVEIELNTTTGVIREKEEVPDGSLLVASLIKNVCNDPVHLNGWLYVNNNTGWVIKPDSTCGIEINSPILKGVYDLAKLIKIVQNIEQCKKINADSRCSFHVHVNLEDLSEDEIGTLMAWWIKCEGVFFDSVISSRKCHRHTQLIGMSNLFEYDKNYSYEHIINVLSDVKYHSASLYHMRQKRRKSVEFRIAGHDFCQNPLAVKNWVRLLLHFVDVASKREFPKKYNKNDVWSGMGWLNTKEVFEFLYFDKNNLSDGMKQIRHWFLNQLKTNTNEPSLGVWKTGARNQSLREVRYLSNLDDFQPSNDINKNLFDPKYDY